MHFKFKHLQKIIGGFFLLTCAAVVVLLGIAARGQRWFQAYTPYVSYFETGGGLRVGTVINIKGLEAGRISSVDLGPDNRVKVGFKVFRNYAGKVTKGASISHVQPLIGSSSLELIPGPDNAQPIAAGGVIPTADGGKIDLNELVANTTRFINDATLLVTNATLLAKNLESPQGDLKKTLANLNSATKQVSEALNEQKGTMGLLLEKRELYDNLLSSTVRLDTVLKGLEESTPDIKDSISEARYNLEEAGKVIRALQKSIFIRGNLEKGVEDPSLRSEGRAP